MEYAKLNEESLFTTDDDDVTFNNVTTSLTLKHSANDRLDHAAVANGQLEEDEERLDVGSPIPRSNTIVGPPSPGPSSSPNAASNHTKRLALGIVFLILVDIIWVASSELTEYIFHEEKFNKPFFSSYVKTSMFLVFLSGFIFWTPWHDQCWLDFGAGRNTTHQHAYRLLASENELQSNSRPSLPAETHEIIDNNANESSLSAPSYIPVVHDVNSGYETDESNPGNQRSVRFSKIAEVRQLSESEANEALFSRLSYQASVQAEQMAKRMSSRLTLPQTAHLSITFCVMWFVAAYSYQLAISNTEAGIVNLLSSSSSLFTLVLAGVFPSNIGDKFTLSKFLAVLVSFGGVMVVTLSDFQLEKSVPFGAVFALISAFFYASYLVFLKRKVDDEEKLDILMFFGFVGLFNLLLLWPLFIVLSYFNVESFEWPTRQQWLFLFLNGFIGTVFAEVLWLWGCFLTSSLIATLAVSLTIPLSMIADIVFRRVSYSSLFYVGSIPMVFSFVIVTLLSHYENWDPVLEFCKRIKRRVFASSRRERENRYQRVRDKDDPQRESLIGNSFFEDEEIDDNDECDVEEHDSRHHAINGTCNGSGDGGHRSTVTTTCETYATSTEIL